VQKLGKSIGLGGMRCVLVDIVVAWGFV